MGNPPRTPASSRRSSRSAARGGRRTVVSRTVVLGVTGLPASGKSTVTGLFRDLGAEHADADRLAHEAMEDPRVSRLVGRALGMEVRSPDGRVDREALAARVFGKDDREALERLTAILHPVVRRGLRGAVAGARGRRAPAVVLDVPLLFEGGVDGMCDATVFVDAPRAVRLRRARKRGWSAAELQRREARQGPARERRARADFRVPNGGSRAATRRRVRAIWDEVTGTGASGRIPAPGK